MFWLISECNIKPESYFLDEAAPLLFYSDSTEECEVCRTLQFSTAEEAGCPAGDMLLLRDEKYSKGYSVIFRAPPFYQPGQWKQGSQPHLTRVITSRAGQGRPPHFHPAARPAMSIARRARRTVDRAGCGCRYGGVAPPDQESGGGGQAGWSALRTGNGLMKNGDNLG